MKRLAMFAAVLTLSAVSAFAGEKAVMHCFAFTPIAEATQADWDAFYKASDMMPKKIKNVKHVWYGKLLRPLNVGGARREHGMCIAFDGTGALYVAQGSARHRPSDWAVDLMSKNAFGSVWRIDLASGMHCAGPSG